MGSATTEPAAAGGAVSNGATRAPRRAVLAIDGADAESFLQGLVTNDVTAADAEKAVYAAHLTPQGKFLADLFIWRPSPETFLVDVGAGEIDALSKRLAMYKLRSAVTIARRDDLAVVLALDDAPTPDGALVRGGDPREPALGDRAIAPADVVETKPAVLDAHGRLALRYGAPEAGLDLIAGDAFILEHDFERLSGVDFRKGCYVGQEVTARMRHKTALRRGLQLVELRGGAPAEDGAVVTREGKPAGRLGTVIDDRALALLRVDRLGDELVSGEATVTPLGAPPIAA